MSEVERLAGDPSALRQLEMLARIAAVGAELRSAGVPLGRIDPNGRSSSESMRSDLAAMKARQWIEYAEDYDGIDYDVTLQQRGRDAAYEFMTLRHDGQARFIRLADDLLKWLSECEINEEHPNVGVFRKSSYGAFMGLVYSDEEQARAMRRLKSEDYIVGQVLNGGLISHPRLTPRGRQLVERRISVFSPERHAGTSVTNSKQVTITGSNGVNVPQQSQDVQQSSTLTAQQAETTRETVVALRSLLEAYRVPPGPGELVEADLEEIEAELSRPDASSARVKDRLEKVGDRVAEMGIDVLTTVASALIEKTMLGL